MSGRWIVLHDIRVNVAAQLEPGAAPWAAMDVAACLTALFNVDLIPTEEPMPRYRTEPCADQPLLVRVIRNDRPEGPAMTPEAAAAYIAEAQDDDADRMAADCDRDGRGHYV